MRLDRDTIMGLIRQHFSPDLQKAVTVTKWKDGIDIDQPTYAIEAFAEAVVELSRPIGEPMDANFKPTRRDLEALRTDPDANGREGLQMKAMRPARLCMNLAGGS